MAGYKWKGTHQGPDLFDATEPNPEPEKPTKTPDGRPLRPHGTRAAYKRHISHGEQPCEQCIIGRRQEEADYRAGTFKPKPQQIAPCGTRGAYERHMRRGEEPDEACRKARSEASRRTWQHRKQLAREAA